MRFFFYGTLLDRDVASLVLGRRLPPQAYTEAALPGHARHRVRGASYPIVVRDPRSQVAGAVVGGLSARDVAQLAAYEGPRYRIVALKVSIAGTITVVSVFEPIEERFQPTSGVWGLTAWQRRYKRAFLARLRLALSARTYSRR
ncbi:MAG TPA: gamma-glutamylcyclotransferase family protein [Reyranella sp.]|nr:gamma-glutamylcyclotransferase family protein [Reyranella sp.]